MLHRIGILAVTFFCVVCHDVRRRHRCQIIEFKSSIPTIRDRLLSKDRFSVDNRQFSSAKETCKTTPNSCCTALTCKHNRSHKRFHNSSTRLKNLWTDTQLRVHGVSGLFDKYNDFRSIRYFQFFFFFLKKWILCKLHWKL